MSATSWRRDQLPSPAHTKPSAPAPSGAAAVAAGLGNVLCKLPSPWMPGVKAAAAAAKPQTTTAAACMVVGCPRARGKP